MRVCVLIEHALAGARAHRFGLSRIVEQLAVGGECLARVVDNEQLLPWLEPALYSLVWVRDDRGRRGRELERAGRRGREHARVRAPGDVQVDPRGRDRLRESIEGDVADEPRAPRIPLEVTAAQRELELGRGATRLADHRRHPVTPELVAVAVEEDVVHFLNRAAARRTPRRRPRRPPRRVGRPAPEAARARLPSWRRRGRTRTGRRRGSS